MIFLNRKKAKLHLPPISLSSDSWNKNCIYPFMANASILYPMKTPESLLFTSVFKGKWEHWPDRRLNLWLGVKWNRNQDNSAKCKYVLNSFFVGNVIWQSILKRFLFTMFNLAKEVLYLRWNEHHLRGYFETLITLLPI